MPRRHIIVERENSKVTTSPLSIPKPDKVRILISVLIIEVLFFLLPTEGRVEGVAATYWNGVKLRLLSGNFLLRGLLSGIGVALLMAALLIFARYLGKFVTPRSTSEDVRASKSDLEKQ
jgi:hypothetical protein